MTDKIMTPIARLRGFSHAAVLGLTVLTTAHAQTTTPAPVAAPVAAPAPLAAPLVRAGTIKQTQGDVWIIRDAATRQPAAPGDSLGLQDQLTTGPNGSARLVLRDDTALTLGPNSVLRLDQFSYDTTTRQGNALIDLLQGSVRVVTGLLAKVNPEVFKVRTPTSVVGVRGTDFIVETEAAR